MAKPGKFFSNSSKSAPATAPATTPASVNKTPVAVKPGINTTPATAAAATMASTVKPGAKAELKPNQGNISRDAVAEAAYFLWLQRGGNETVNWLEAEAMLARKAAALK